MIAYKLVRKLKDGTIASLFINKRYRMEYNKWLKAECYPTKGFAVRPGWHCTHKPEAPHLSDKDRCWIEVEIKDYTEFMRPENQGGMWYLANYMKVRKILTEKEIKELNENK